MKPEQAEVIRIQNRVQALRSDLDLCSTVPDARSLIGLSRDIQDDIYRTTEKLDAFIPSLCDLSIATCGLACEATNREQFLTSD
ncbi:hypothetical protein [Endozoicomonas sp.]|uniref:hypothetical protein n=1 Tax=Endozoicomonas sp. TaxID=1892382 RepID=UPI002885C206|nr:hypothetical protein [Endozoicomonas sp.]